MAKKTIAPLRYSYEGVLLSDTGIDQADLDSNRLAVEQAWQEVIDEDVRLYASGQSPLEKQPLDAGFFEMPERLLAEYQAKRGASELGQILATADRLRENVDRVVMLGIGGSYMGARALMDACCHPYHNELDRGRRGGRPRMYFEGNNVDNDSIQGLLDLMAASDDPWGIVVISKSGGTLETAVTFRLFLDALRKTCGDDNLPHRVVPVTGREGKLFELSKAIGCEDIFYVPDGVGGRFSVLSAVGLLPAAMLGIDVVRLLEGAAAMNEHFRTTPVGENIVLDYVRVCSTWEERHNAHLRVLSVWSSSLESVGLWYDQLLAESNGKDERGATPLTVVNTRDLHSRAQQHQEGMRDKLITNVIVESWRNDPLTIANSEWNQDGLNDLAGKTVPQIMTAAIEGTNEAYRSDGRPTADIFMPAVDEASLGQLFQMFMLATVVEGRMMGINPYGQPGVEKYKGFMKQNLTG